MSDIIHKIVIMMTMTIIFSNPGSGSILEMNKCHQEDLRSLLSRGGDDDHRCDDDDDDNDDDDDHRCRPRKVTVELDTRSAWPGHALLAPTHSEVSRCVGSCGHYFHSCNPTSIGSIKMPVIMSEITVKEGVTETRCGHIEIEEHLTCGCGCDVTDDTCTEDQTFLQFECRCVCNNHNDRDLCLARGRRWDRDSCTCQCPGGPYPTCPNGYVYDYLNTCGCVAIHSQASAKIMTMFVITLTLFLALVMTVGNLILSKSKSNEIQGTKFKIGGNDLIKVPYDTGSDTISFIN